MKYGKAIEAMKNDGVVFRKSAPDAMIFLAYAGTPQVHFVKSTPDGHGPYLPSVADQLAEDWKEAF